MDMTNQEYSRYVEQKAKPSPIWKNLTWAFCTGGLICTGGQALLNLYRGCGLSEGDAGTAVSVTIIFLAALFTGLGWFDRLAKHAGAGTLVPITGFAKWGWGPGCSPSPGRCWPTASAPPSSTAWCSACFSPAEGEKT